MKTPTLKRALLALTLLLSTASVWAADYVITYTSNGTTHYLAYENGGLTDKTTFDPATCIWEGSNNSKFKCKGASGNCYLRYNSGLTNSNQNNGSNWTIDGNYIYYTNNSQRYYINYGNSWNATQASRSSGWFGGYTYTPPTNSTILYQITTSNVGESVTMSEIEGSTTIGTGTANYTCTANYYTAGTLYQWDGGSYSNVTATPLTVTWNATGLPASGVTFSNGTITVTTLPANRTTITITATATHNGQTYQKEITVTLRGVNDPIETGIDGNTVVLMDWEDLSWTYYAGVDASVDGGNYNNNYLGKLYSPNARNIIIEYRGGSVNNASAVAISGQTGENQNKMVYYQTMEEGSTLGEYPYTVIPNPFSKRPAVTNSNNTKTYYGFAGWKLIEGANYVKNKNTNAVLSLDEGIIFENLPEGSNPRIVFEATWTQANVQTGTSVPSFTGGTYETNFWVITGGNVSSGLGSLSTNMTVTMYYPDNVKAETDTRSISSGLTVSNSFSGTVKFEYVNFNTTSNINAGGRNLYLGRGITNSKNSGNEYIYGCNTSSTQVNQTVRVESGKYEHFYHYAKAPSSITKQIVIFGCDYDRAKGDNNKLDFTGVCKISSSITFGLSNSTTMLTYTYSKSGKIMSSRSVNDAKTADVYYFSPDGNDDYKGGCRYLEIQGGEWCSIAGGFDKYHNSTDPAFTFRMKGGKLRGSIYGSGEYLEARGIRVYVITGGEINGWVAGGANGTQESGGGVTTGTTYVYVGGNARIDSHGSTTKINNSVGGNVYGAGCGLSATSASGSVTLGTNVVIADEAFVERGVYGGGGFGYCNTDQTATMYITGGTVNAGLGAYNGSSYIASIQGGVFGGASMNKGGSAQIYMTGGTVKHGIYGGSNMSGTLNGSTTIKMVGGKVGLSSSEQGHICGGGFGSDTRVKENTDVTIGGDATVYGEVYGGSEQGLVNTDANSDSYQQGKHVNVTVSGGTIHGAVYGGGLGNSANAANTYGNTKVTISGGTVDGNVFGCNNVNGRPFDSTVQVEMTDGTVKKHVFGGGNQAGYTGNTEVKILGGTVEGNVYGGGYGTNATVTGNTNVIIGQ